MTVLKMLSIARPPKVLPSPHYGQLINAIIIVRDRLTDIATHNSAETIDGRHIVHFSPSSVHLTSRVRN